MRIKFFLVFLFLNLVSYSQDIPFKDYQTCLYGFKNNKGNWIIEPVFTSATEFYKGKSIVSIDSLYGIIDENGKFILPAEYSFITFTEENSSRDCPENFVVSKFGKTGVLSYNLNWIIKPQYDEIQEMVYCKFYKYKLKDKWGILGKNFEIISDTIFDSQYIYTCNYFNSDSMFSFYKENKFGII